MTPTNCSTLNQVSGPVLPSRELLSKETVPWVSCSQERGT